MSVDTHAAGDIRLNEMFIKQEIDMMCAQAWLTEDPKEEARLKEEAIDKSIEHNVPCVYTQMISFTTTPEKAAQWEKDKKIKKKGKGAMVAAVVGGAVVIGAIGLAIYAFGDVGATTSGASSALGSAFTGGTGQLSNAVDCCNCMSLCPNFCDKVPCCGDCWSGFSECGNLACPCCQGCSDAIGSAAAGCTGACEGICGACGGLIEGCSSACAGCGECCGTFFTHLGACAGMCLECIGGLCSALGSL